MTSFPLSCDLVTSSMLVVRRCLQFALGKKQGTGELCQLDCWIMIDKLIGASNLPKHCPVSA